MPLWLAAAPLVLASRSAVRRTLLEAAGVPVEICPADIDERGVEAGAPLQAPVAIAALLAREKAALIAERNRGRLVLAADQTLSLDGRRFAKPADQAAARAQLRALSGRTHELYSAIAFVQDGAVLCEHVGDAATASVGAYQLEGFGIQLFERLDGDYFTVLGLPLLTALDFLRRHGCLAQ